MNVEQIKQHEKQDLVIRQLIDDFKVIIAEYYRLQKLGINEENYGEIMCYADNYPRSLVLAACDMEDLLVKSDEIRERINALHHDNVQVENADVKDLLKFLKQLKKV